MAEEVLKEQMLQRARAGVPFNPLGRDDIVGLNVVRLQKSMKSFGWSDPRFVTKAQANANGWSLDRGAESVELTVRNPVSAQVDKVSVAVAPGALAVELAMRDPVTGQVDKVAVFNAASVVGMPSLAAMLAMSEADLLKLKAGVMLDSGEVVAADVGVVQEDDVELLVTGVGRALAVPIVTPEGVIPDASPLLDGGVGSGISSPVSLIASSALDAGPARFAVMAPYWVNGLHNAEGIALAAQINKSILEKSLSENRDAISRLLSLQEKARLLGLSVVPESQYLNDPDIKRDTANPRSLLDGALARDKDGSYRPKEGGPAVLQDKGDSLVLKSKGAQAFQGAMELAVAKGWTAIELKGKPAMMADAWVEAKLMGLDVVNYKPSEKDMARFEARLVEENQKRIAVAGRPAEQAPEMVVERAFVNAKGQTETAKMTYTVAYEGGQDQRFDNVKDAARAYAGLPAGALPIVVRSVMRAEGEVVEGVIAGVSSLPGQGGVGLVREAVLDREFDEAMDEMVEERRLALVVPLVVVPSVNTGPHYGEIVKVEGGRVAQDVGRGQVVWHDVANLRGVVPRLGDKADIQYANGIGRVKAKAVENGVQL